ncbi:MAG: ribonuclease P protein component [Clostridia bacterium]|nr:ribonuclease P protein component [Clostridia bacterium]
MKSIAISENHLYKKVYAKGDKVNCRHIVVYVLTDYHASRLMRENPLKTRVNRIGLTVSKKIGKAVVRSRVRRIIRAALYAVQAEKPLKTGKLIVIVAKESAAGVKSTDILCDLYRAFDKLGMFAA